MNEDINTKMQRLMYFLTKQAAAWSYKEFLEGLDISDEDYKQIKQIWKDKLNITPYV